MNKLSIYLLRKIYIPYYTEQLHNESIDMTYLIKRYMNIAPTGHNLSFTEWYYLPYSVLLRFIPPRNIVITT